MNFLNPLFLFGMLAATIPILIHLFTRRRPREIPFSSLEFLTEVHRSEIRRMRLRQILLLLLRTLAVMAIAMAMSRPVLRAGTGSRQGAATTVVALVDRSGSMGARTPAGTRIGEARQVLETLLATLAPGDDMLLVPYDEGPQPMSPRPSSDLPRLRAAVQGLAAAARRTDHAQALAFAARALADSRSLNRELYWISDFQAAGFGSTPAGRIALPPGPWDGVRSYLVPATTTRLGNVGLLETTLAPAEGGAALAVSAGAFGAVAGDLAVAVRELPGGEEIGRGFLAVPGRGEAATLVPLARLPGGGGEVLLPDDALPLDNRRVFAAGRAGTLRVLLREDGPPSALRLALEAGSPASGLVVDAADPSAVPARIDDADVVVVHDVERLGAGELQAILDHRRGGGALLLIPGRRADPAFWNASLLGELGVGRLGEVVSATGGGAWRLRRRAAGHAALAGFGARPGEPLSTARFQAVRAFAAAPGARVLLEFDSSHPALIEAGQVLALLAPLDPQASDLPVSGAFLPLIHQTVKVLGRGTAAPSLVPGERYVAPAGTGAWRIEDEAGREVAAEVVTLDGATRLQSAALESPGLYRVLQAGQLRASFAVNPDARESDLSAMPEAAMVSAFPPGRVSVLRPGADLERRVREARHGRELWSWFVLLALALLVTETILGRSGLGRVAGEPAPA